MVAGDHYRADLCPCAGADRRACGLSGRVDHGSKPQKHAVPCAVLPGKRQHTQRLIGELRRLFPNAALLGSRQRDGFVPQHLEPTLLQNAVRSPFPIGAHAGAGGNGHRHAPCLAVKRLHVPDRVLPQKLFP